MKYSKWCEMSDEQARREFGRLERRDAIYEAAFTFVGCLIVGALIWFGIWLWD